MKKYGIIYLICFSLFFTGCSSRARLFDGFFSSNYPKPYVCLDEKNAETAIKGVNWNKILESIPNDHYEAYPGLHTVPLSATLYNGNKVEEIDINDPRLIKMMNFYHNVVYFGVYSYTQGPFLPEEYLDLASTNYRLELTYEPIYEGCNLETTFDKILIVDCVFVGVCSNTPRAEYPFCSYGRYPLHVQSIHWLELFGLH